MPAGEPIVGLDIGTTKICCVIAEVDKFKEPKILGVGVCPSQGLRKGVVINLDQTVQSIKKSVKEAELMAGVEVNVAYTGIAGDHIKSLNSKGVVAVSHSDNEISEDDVTRVLEAARAIALPLEREIIHVLPQEFIVDEQKGIKEPIGMSGVRLEVEAHIITSAVTSAQNLYKSVERAGIHITDLVLEPFAAGFAILGEDEKELGVGLIDLGGGTTDITLFYDGSIRHSAIIGLGGSNVTNDIAFGLRTPIEQAEEIKINHGCCLKEMSEPDDTIHVPGIGGRPPRQVSKSVLVSIIQPRMEEIFELALREIKKSDYLDLLSSGIVLTGGGSMIEGTAELAEQIFGLPVRIGYPKGFGGLVDTVRTPVFSTAVGLVLYGIKKESGEKRFDYSDISKNGSSIISKIGKIFKSFFE